MATDLAVALARIHWLETIFQRSSIDVDLSAGPPLPVDVGTQSLPVNIIERLPKELQLCIYDFLGYIDAIRLAQTSKLFDTTVDPQKWPASEKARFVQAAQWYDKHNLIIRLHDQDFFNVPCAPLKMKSDGYACFHCYKVLPRSAFSNSQTSRKHLKSTVKHWNGQYDRFCLEYGLKKGVYRPGTTIRIVTDERFPTHSHHQNDRPVTICDDVMFCGKCNALTEYEEVLPRLSCNSCQNLDTYALRQVKEGRKTEHHHSWNAPTLLGCRTCGKKYEEPTGRCSCYECRAPRCRVCTSVRVVHTSPTQTCSRACEYALSFEQSKNMSRKGEEVEASQAHDELRRQRIQQSVAVNNVDVLEKLSRTLPHCPAELFPSR